MCKSDGCESCLLMYLRNINVGSDALILYSENRLIVVGLQ